MDLDKIRLSHLHYMLQYNFWVGFESEKLKSLYWYLEETQSHSMRPTAMITMCKYYFKSREGASILCTTDPSVKAKSQVSLYASLGNLIVKIQHSTRRQAKKKICANLDHHWSKKCSFLCGQTNWVCPSGTQRFCKNDPDSSLESLIVTRVASSHHFSQRDSSRVRVIINRHSSRVIDSSHAITTCKICQACCLKA